MTAASFATTRRPDAVHYPDSDGEPMAENMTQFRWIVTIKENLDALLPDLVAGDMFWYPIEGDNRTRRAPDVMVALGRPKGERRSYLQWEEDNIPPRVVFEVMSPGNDAPEMVKKLAFYDRHGVSEYYIFDPDRHTLVVYLRQHEHLEQVPFVGGWVSPLLGIRFHLGADLELYGPAGERFLTFGEQLQRAEAEAQRAEAEAQRAEAEAQRAEAERRRADALAAKLKALGIDPDA